MAMWRDGGGGSLCRAPGVRPEPRDRRPVLHPDARRHGRRRDPRRAAGGRPDTGATGPYAHLSGFGLVAEAYSGLMSLTGEPDGPPMHFGTALADVNSAVHALAAIGAALHHRQHTGQGTHVDISAFDSLFAMIDQ